jgi:hypothetical protein
MIFARLVSALHALLDRVNGSPWATHEVEECAWEAAAEARAEGCGRWGVRWRVLHTVGVRVYLLEGLAHQAHRGQRYSQRRADLLWAGGAMASMRWMAQHGFGSDDDIPF